MSGSSDIRPPQPSTLAQNHPDHPKLADLGLKEEHCMWSHTLSSLLWHHLLQMVHYSHVLFHNTMPAGGCVRYAPQLPRGARLSLPTRSMLTKLLL